MTTASVLLTVSTTWGTNSDLCDKEDRVSRSVRNIAAVAARELRETPGTRDQALKIMRDWIEQNSDIKNVRTAHTILHLHPATPRDVMSSVFLVGDLPTLRFPVRGRHSSTLGPQRPSVLQAMYPAHYYFQLRDTLRHIVKYLNKHESFLLRFLRHKKYSIPMAQQTLLKYLSLRKYYPSIYTNLDSEDPTLKEIVRNGYIAVSPVRDNKGRRVIVYNMGKFNAIKFNCWDMCRAHMIVYEALMEDATDQIFGFTHVGDGSGSSTAHVTSWNPVDFARLMKWGEQSMPMRHKEFQLVNVPATLKYIIDFAASKVSNKMSERLHIHTNIKTLQSNVDVSCLPTTYGGHIPLQDMIKYTEDLLAEKRKVILSLERMEILSTKGIVSTRKPVNALKGDAISVEGSFRKLEID